MCIIASSAHFTGCRVSNEAASCCQHRPLRLQVAGEKPVEGKPHEAGQAGPVKDSSWVWDTLNVVRLSAGPTGARSNLHALSGMTRVDSHLVCRMNSGKT